MLYFNLIASMLVLIYKTMNKIKSYKMAKIQFFKELLLTIMQKVVEIDDGAEWVKKCLINYIKKE